MAEPKISSVNISQLQQCNPDLMEGLKQPQLVDKMRDVLKNSDLKYDEKTQTVIASDNATKIQGIVQQAEMVRTYLKAAGGDNDLSLADAQGFIDTHEEYSDLTADAFLAEAQDFIKKRWGIVCDNLKQYSMEYPLQNLVNNLSLYNDGIYKEEFEQGRMSFSPLKTPLNAISFIPNIFLIGVNPWEKPLKAWDVGLRQEKTIDPTWMSGDNLAMEDAYKDHLKRECAVEFLRQVLNKDIEEKGGVAWNAFRKDPKEKEKDLEAKKKELEQQGKNPEEVAKELEIKQRSSAEDILKLLENAEEKDIKLERDSMTANPAAPTKVSHVIKMKGAEAAEILREQLAFADLFALLMTADPGQRYKNAITFAENERPKYGGVIGGGHSNHWDWDNVTPGVNNFYFARSLLDTVIREGNPVQQAEANDLLYRKMAPSAEGPHATEEGGGSIGLKIPWAISELIFFLPNWGLKTNLHPIPYRAMPDEEVMYAPERVIRAGLLVYAGPTAWGGIKGTAAKIGEWGGPKLEAWRNAGKFSEQATKWGKTAWVLQRGALGVTWGGNKIWEWATLRPLWRKWSHGDEYSPRAQMGKRAWDGFGKLLFLGAATFKFDEYSTPIGTDRHHPNLDVTARAEMMTLDPLPPLHQAKKK